MPSNLEILLSHLKCAAFELPIQDGELFGPHPTGQLCEFLANDLRLLHHSGDSWHWVNDSYPADAVSLRAITSDNFVVVDITGDHKIIGEVDFPAALTTLHEKAIYLHDSRQYQVEKLDYDGRKAFVRRVDSDYFTDANVYTQVKELATFEIGCGYRRKRGACRTWRGARETPSSWVQEDQVLHARERRSGPIAIAGTGNAHHRLLAALSRVSFLARFSDLSPVDLQGALVAVGNLIQTTGALLLMCDTRDLGVAITEDISQDVISPSPAPMNRICSSLTIIQAASGKASRCMRTASVCSGNHWIWSRFVPARRDAQAALDPSAKWVRMANRGASAF